MMTTSNKHNNAPAVPAVIQCPISIGGSGAELARVTPDGDATIHWAAVEQAAKEDNHFLSAMAKLLIAARDVGRAAAPAVPQGYEIHEIPADYSGLVWLEGQVRAVARRAQAATGPQGWTDADSDAARLALELECLLMDTKDLSVVSKWWGSANEALELHRQRLAATPAPAPAQEVATLSLSAEDVHAAFAKNFPKPRISQDWINFAADIAQAIAALAAKPAQDAGLTDEVVNDAAKVLAERFDYPWEHMPEEGRKNMRTQARAVVEAALRAKGASDV